MFNKILLLSSLAAIGAYAQNATRSMSSAAAAQTTMNLFLDGNPSEGYVASVVGVGCGETTYAIACTKGDFSVGTEESTCNPDYPALATYSPGWFEVSTQSVVAEVTATLIETCSIDGTTAAVCSAYLAVTSGGKHTKTSSTVTYSGAEVASKFYQVPITAGVQALSTTTSCTGNAAAPTGVADVYKVLIVPGAAALLAGAAFV